MSFIKHISTSSISDRQLIDSYKQTGDLKWLAALYQPYMELVYGVCLKYLQDEEKAKDAVMSIFEELLVKLQKHEVDNFKGWLYTLSRNHCLMQLRSTKNMRAIAFDPERMQITEELHLNGVFEKEDQLDQLHNCLETLSPDQKTTVSLFYLETKSYKEIAALTGMDWNKIRSLMQNGRRNLKICMESKLISK